LHLILQREICAREQLEQGRQIGGKLLPQISFDSRLNGQRFRCCGSRLPTPLPGVFSHVVRFLFGFAP
jgi:hypothetical protein